MPLPLLPIIAIGVAGLAGGLGLGEAHVGKVKMDQAQIRIDKAKSKYEHKKANFDREQKAATNVLDELGKTRTEIQSSFSRFADAFERIKNRPEQREVGKEHFKFTSIDLRDIRQASVSALDIIGSLVAAAGAGGTVAAGVWATVALLGTASTGAAIAGLHGVAATNALLACLGGGALAAGGWGMAGGMAVLGGLVAGPAVLAGGLFANLFVGDKLLEQADKAEREVDSAVEKMDKSIAFSKNISNLAAALLYELRKANFLYETKVSQLEELVARCDDYNFFSEEDKILLDNNIMLVKVLMEMTRADLLRKDEEGKPIMKAEAIREREVLALIDDSERSLNEIAA